MGELSRAPLCSGEGRLTVKGAHACCTPHPPLKGPPLPVCPAPCPFFPCCFRWTGKKATTLPSGHKVDFVKAGGRTSAYVPALQKLTGKPGSYEQEGSRGASHHHVVSHYAPVAC